jgi:phage baseplate assembly protein W
MTATNGPHLSFPFRIAADGRTAQVRTLEEHVRDELIQLILTDLGERADLPELGGGVRRLVFEGAGLTTSAMAKAMLSQALSRWLARRVTVEQLAVAGVNDTLTVDLVYRVAGSPDQRLIRFQRNGG